MINDADKAIITKLDKTDPLIWLATWFGAGFLPKAPGTWGSIAALPFIILAFIIAGIGGVIGFIAFTICIGFPACRAFESQTQIHDCKMVVIDEAAGQAIALLPMFVLTGLNPFLCFIGFLLFRIFDTLKPWPISHFDRHVPGAMGVMGDDIIAGAFAAICLMGLIYVGFG